ncbi:MAG: hypothetical protein P8M18_05540, partial [Woeseiaceae bacterium]|nr:hypothetical protein [Woeseiaceae bacterium]
ANLPLSFSAFAETLLNSNTVNVEELAALPYMDTILAEMILEKRPYPSISVMNDMLLVELNETQLEKLYAHVFIPIKLNVGRIAIP